MQDNYLCWKHQFFITSIGRKRWNKSVLPLWLWPIVRWEIRLLYVVFRVKAEGMVCSGFKLINANWGKWECLEAPDISSSGRNTKLSSSFLSDKATTKLLWSLCSSLFPSPLHTHLNPFLLLNSQGAFFHQLPILGEDYYLLKYLNLTSSVLPVYCGTAHNSIYIHCIEFQYY